jgi:hypothetical protein
VSIVKYLLTFLHGIVEEAQVLGPRHALWVEVEVMNLSIEK